jgi:hypothetical protein
MSLKIDTAAPQALLAAVRDAIDKGHVRTWSYDADGDFTHTAEQWKNKAWLRPSVQPGMLELNIVAPQGQAITYEVNAIYHGRFIEMLLAHFGNRFSVAKAAA